MNEQEKNREDVLDAEEGVEETERSERRMEENRDQTKAAKSGTEEEPYAPLFEKNQAEEFRSHWLDIQSRFVDDPRDSVKRADELVADVIKSLTNTFAQKRIALENQWNSGDSASTEDLRIAIKRYRSFFDRLLTLES